MQYLQGEIEEKVGINKEELQKLLEDLQEILGEIIECKRVPKRNRFFEEVGKHFKNHSWFYTSVMQILGQQIFSMFGK